LRKFSSSCSSVTGCKASASCSWRCSTHITWNCHTHCDVCLVSVSYQPCLLLVTTQTSHLVVFRITAQLAVSWIKKFTTPHLQYVLQS
jgi:hypothetical protein